MSLLLFSANVFAVELNGTLSSNGNGIYSVDAQDGNGTGYKGTANVSDGDDGTLDITITDDQGTEFTGTAKRNKDNGSFDLELQSDAGTKAEGSITLDQ